MTVVRRSARRGIGKRCRKEPLLASDRRYRKHSFGDMVNTFKVGGNSRCVEVEIPFTEVSAMQARIENMKLASQEIINIRLLCRRFWISSATAYKWIRRYRDGGEADAGHRQERHS